MLADLNVEQLQLLLLVWHNFTREQRDGIIMLCINALSAISQQEDLSDKVPLYCLRLVTIVDYMIYQYHDPPPELVTQVCQFAVSYEKVMSDLFSYHEPPKNS